jgi:hypothetical protein
MDARALRSTFTGELADQLAGAGAAELAAKTGLHESIVQEMTLGTSQGLLSWEIVSACVATAELGQETVVQLRELWVKTESAEWAARGPKLLREIERRTLQARRQRTPDDKLLTRRLFDEYRPTAPWRKTPGSGHPHGQWRFEPWSSTQLLNKQRIPIPDPDRAMSLSEFYDLLKQLHQWAGRPPYAEIGQRSWGALSRTTVGNMLGASRAMHAHVRDHDYLRYMATVFGLPQTEVERWINAYSRLRELAPDPVPPVVEQKAVAGRPSGSTPELPVDLPSGRGFRTEQSPEAPQPDPIARTMARLRRWRITALCFAVSTIALSIALALVMPAGDPPAAQSLRLLEKLRLSPEKPVRIPLRLSAGDWSLVLRFRLESTEVASPCVHDAQLSYVVEKANGVDIASEKMAKGSPDSSTRAIRLDLLSERDSPRVVVSVSVPSYDIGCGFTIDLSGSIIQPR